MSDYYYDRTGKPIDVDKWAEYFENLDYKIVARDVLDGLVHATKHAR